MGFTASDNKKHAEVCHRGLSCGCCLRRGWGRPRLPHLRLRPEPLRLCWTPLRRLCWLRCLSLLQVRRDLRPRSPHYANSGGAVHVVKREAEAEPEAKAEADPWTVYGYGYPSAYRYGYAAAPYYRAYGYPAYGYYGGYYGRGYYG